MDSKYLLSKGIYKELVDDLLYFYTIPQLISILIGSKEEYRRALIAANTSFLAPGARQFSTLDPLSIRSYILEAIRSDKVRSNIIDMIRSGDGFYDFMELYLKDYDYAKRLTDLYDHRTIQKIVHELKIREGLETNLFFFHPHIYHRVSWMYNKYNHHLPVVESLLKEQDKFVINKNLSTAIEMNRDYYISKADIRYKKILFTTTDRIIPELWYNVPIDVGLLDMFLYVHRDELKERVTWTPNIY